MTLESGEFDLGDTWESKVDFHTRHHSFMVEPEVRYVDEMYSSCETLSALDTIDWDMPTRLTLQHTSQ